MQIDKEVIPIIIIIFLVGLLFANYFSILPTNFVWKGIEFRVVGKGEIKTDGPLYIKGSKENLYVYSTNLSLIPKDIEKIEIPCHLYTEYVVNDPYMGHPFTEVSISLCKKNEMDKCQKIAKAFAHCQETKFCKSSNVYDIRISKSMGNRWIAKTSYDTYLLELNESCPYEIKIALTYSDIGNNARSVVSAVELNNIIITKKVEKETGEEAEEKEPEKEEEIPKEEFEEKDEEDKELILSIVALIISITALVIISSIINLMNNAK